MTGLHRAAIGFFTVLAALNLPAQDREARRIAVKEYRDKVYGSWLGQCIGNIYGLPHETAISRSRARRAFRTATGGTSRPSSGSMESFRRRYRHRVHVPAGDGKARPEPTLGELGAMWKYHVRNRVWLANRAALAAINHGFTPPSRAARS